jgi:hypothetical protein
MANESDILLRLKAIDEMTPVMARAVSVMEQQTSALTSMVEKMGESTEKTGAKNQNLNTGMVNLAATFGVVKMAADVVVKAYQAVSEHIGKAIDEAEQAEIAHQRLTGALVATGNYTQELVNKVEAYSEAVKQATGASDEQVKIMVAQGVQMGLSVDRAMQLEKATRMLAAATGKDANEAFSLMQGSLTGQSRGLAKVLPQVKDLTEAQLKSGEAADLVIKSFEAQYSLYEKSFAVSVKTAIDDMYESLGNIIIQNPAVIKGVEMVANAANFMAEKIQGLGKWIEANQDVLERLGVALFKVGQLIFDVISIALKPLLILFEEMPGPMMAVTAGIIAMTGPVGLLFAAVGALTAAFAKWPGLFDVIEGAFKQMFGFLLNATAVAMKGIGEFVSIFNDDLGTAIETARQKVEDYSLELGHQGEQQRIVGQETNTAADITFKAAEATDTHTKAIDENLKRTSDSIRAQKQLAEAYAGIIIGTKASREALSGEIQARDQDLKNFQDYLESKKRLAVTAEVEQQNQLAQVRSKEIGGGTGSEAIQARLDAQLSMEAKHQSDLAVLRKTGVITQAQYNEAMLESKMKMDQLDLQREQSHQQALAQIYGDSPAGFENRQAIEAEQFEQKLAQQSEQLERLGQNEAQVAEFQKQQRSQFQAAQLEQQKAHDEQMILLATESSRRKAEALGDTPEAMQLKMQMEEQQFQLDLQNKIARAQQEGATDAEINSMKANAELEHKNRLTEINASYYEREAARQEQAGNDWEAFLARRSAAMERHGAVMGTMQTIQSSQYYKAEQQMLTDLSSLRNSKSEGMFKVGKAAAIAQATVNTFMGATAAFTSLAGIPIVGPALGAAAAAAAIASGLVQVQNIKGQQFQGGQADSGMDSVPQALSGKSFILSGGERVVQPTGNKDLTDFLEREKLAAQQGAGAAAGGGGINVTLHYNGMGGREDAKKMVELVFEEIRVQSARGRPIMSSRGIVDG